MIECIFQINDWMQRNSCSYLSLLSSVFEDLEEEVINHFLCVILGLVLSVEHVQKSLNLLGSVVSKES